MLMQIGMSNKQRGIGLLELMLSLAIIAVLLVMATRYYKTAHTGQQVNDAVGMIEAIRGASAQWEAGRPTYTGIDMAKLDQYGLIPKDVAGNSSPAGSGTNPWGGDVSVRAASGGAQIDISLTNVPKDACHNLISRLRAQALSTNPQSENSCANNTDFHAFF